MGTGERSTLPSENPELILREMRSFPSTPKSGHISNSPLELGVGGIGFRSLHIPLPPLLSPAGSDYCQTPGFCGLR